MIPLDQVQNGDVLAFKTRGIASWFIKLRTFSRVSHIGFAFWLRGELWIIEAKDWYYVQLFPLRRYLQQKNTQIVHYKLKPEFKINRDKVVEKALSICGNRYASPWQFVRSWGILTCRICDWLGIKKDLDEDRAHCSETVFDCLVAGGMESLKDSSRVSPGDIIELDCLYRNGVLSNENS